MKIFVNFNFKDKALMRPGRIDRLIYVPPPDTPAREEIFKIHTKNISGILHGVDMNNLIEQTEGYTGAEIAQICKEAVMVAFARDKQLKSINGEDFQEAITRVKPRTTPESLAFYQAFESNKIM